MVRKRSEIQRHAERAVPEKAAEILMAGRVAHVAFTADEQPFAIPFGYQFARARDGAAQFPKPFTEPHNFRLHL